MTALGAVEAHYLLCPFCGQRQDLTERRCVGCGAKPVGVLWEPGSPELALVGRRQCGCRAACGDDGDADGPGVCKGLPRPPAPLVEVVLVRRSA